MKPEHKLNSVNRTVFLLLLPSLVIIMLIAMIAIYYYRSIKIEDYCQTQARLNVPQGKLVPPTLEEKKKFPGIGSTDTQFRVKLQCETEHRLFGIF